jgi:hypothetical protein
VVTNGSRYSLKQFGFLPFCLLQHTHTSPKR